MKRSRSSAGRPAGGRKGKPAGRSSGPKKSFSKSPRGVGSRGGAGKPFRPGKRDEERPERRRTGDYSKPFRAGRSDSDSPGNRSYGEKAGDRFDRFKPKGDRPERRSFDRTDKPERKSFDSPRRSSSRAGGFKSRDERPVRKAFDKPDDRSTGGGTYLRRKDNRTENPLREDGGSDTKKFERTARDYSESSDRKERTPFREKRPFEHSADSGDRKKRKRIGDGEKSFVRKEERGSGNKFKSERSTQKSDSPRAYGENRYNKTERPEKRKSFSRPVSGDRPERPWNRKEKHEFYGDRKKSPPMPKTHEDGSTRLNKFIANAGICSRREADEMIEAGVISVNGKVITEMGFKVMPGDEVKYNNELLRTERMVYILLNKPKDFITTTNDPEDRKTVMSLIAKACRERVYPVGRLDRNTTGLLLFTNDGDLAKKLTHPSFEVQKVYQVELDRSLKTSDMEEISKGIELEDGFIKADEIVYAGNEKNVIGIELHSGKNRIVRRIFEHLEYEVKKLDRVVFAGLTKKDLPRGRWRFLTDMEIANLKMATGKRRFREKV